MIVRFVVSAKALWYGRELRDQTWKSLLKTSIKEKKRDNAANKQCSHLKVFSNYLAPANNTWSTPRAWQSCKLVGVNSVLARCCISRYLRKWFVVVAKESRNSPASTECSTCEQQGYESRDVCCEQHNGVELLQSALTKGDCLLISGRGLHTQRS